MRFRYVALTCLFGCCLAGCDAPQAQYELDLVYFHNKAAQESADVSPAQRQDVADLLAASGTATPSMAPVPKRSRFGETFFSTA